MHMFLTKFVRNLIQKRDLAGSSDTEKKRKAGSYGILWDPESRKFLLSRDVIFDENLLIGDVKDRNQRTEKNLKGCVNTQDPLLLLTESLGLVNKTIIATSPLYALTPIHTQFFASNLMNRSWTPTKKSRLWNKYKNLLHQMMPTSM